MNTFTFYFILVYVCQGSCFIFYFLFFCLCLVSGWTKRVEYTPGSGNIPLFPNLHLETCEETVWNIQATVELQTGHIGKGCDRDSYSDRSVRRLCGGSGSRPPLHPHPHPVTMDL